MKKSDKEHIEPVQLKKEKELFINSLISGNVEFTIFSNQFTSFHTNSKQLLKNIIKDFLFENERLNDLFLNAPTGYIILNSSFQVKEANNLACQLLQKNRERLLNKDFSRLIAPECLDSFQFFMKNLKAGKVNNHCNLHLKVKGDTLITKFFGLSGMEMEIENQSFRLMFFEEANEKSLEQKSGLETYTDKWERQSNTELQTDNANGLNGTDKILDKLTVLVADDDEVARIFLSELLVGKCKKVLFAKNGKEAVELYQTNDGIDMVLMDIKMPVMDGYSATIKIKEMDKKAVIIAQTAFALARDREKALAAGCSDYLAKPLMKKDLISVIDKFFK